MGDALAGAVERIVKGKARIAAQTEADLDAVQLQHLHHGFGAGDLIHSRLPSLLMVLAERTGWAIIEPRHDDCQPSEIGRAALRARGCQSLSFSVVAVLLEKKK